MSFLCKVELANISGMPEDTVTNTWAFLKNGGIDGNDMAEEVASALIDFYTGSHDGVAESVSWYFSGALSRAVNACQVKVYNLAADLDEDVSLGAPVHVDEFTLQAKSGGSVDLPNEIAVVLSLEAAGRAAAPVNIPGGAAGPAGDTRPKQRRSGRIYLGPCNNQVLAGADGGDVRIDDEFMGVVFGAVGELHQDVVGLAQTHNIGVWSRKDEIVRPVDAVSIDNAVDIVRSRGLKATARTRVLL